MNDSPPAAPRNGALASIFRALKHRNYRLFFGGQGLSLIGTWMTRVATSWLIYELTNQDWMLGIISFAGQIPILIFAPMAGVWVEGIGRQRILVVTQALAMLQSFALAGLCFAGLIQVWQVLALAVVQGLINAVDTPARQAFVVEIIEDRSDLSNAIALNSSMFNAARLVGPSIAGVLYAQVGAGLCFLIDGISYLAVIAALLAMKVRPHPLKIREHNVWHDLKEGFNYVFNLEPLRSIFLLLGLVSIVGMPYTTLLPVFAKTFSEQGSATALGDGRGERQTVARDTVADGSGLNERASHVPGEPVLSRRGAMTYGFMLAASGTGALCGALYLASRHSVVGLGRVIAMNATMFGVSMLAFAFSPYLWLSIGLSFTAGFGMMVHMAASNTIVQTVVDDDKRARVMGFYTMAVLGLAPIGSLLTSGLVRVVSTPYTVAIGGGLSLLGAVIFAWRLPALRIASRPMLEKAGIVPPLMVQ